MFNAGYKYRHKCCLDVDILVKQVVLTTDDYVLLRVIYLNRNWAGGNFVIDPVPETIAVPKENYRHWMCLSLA
jgi:hypothetical protein